MEVTKEYLESMGYCDVRQLKDGTWVGLSLQIYTVGLVVGLNVYGYEFRYCYEYLVDAHVALDTMEYKNEIPIGPWIKRKGEGGEAMGPGAKGE